MSMSEIDLAQVARIVNADDELSELALVLSADEMAVYLSLIGLRQEPHPFDDLEDGDFDPSDDDDDIARMAAQG
jgi:hypothetical protein